MSNFHPLGIIFEANAVSFIVIPGTIKNLFLNIKDPPCAEARLRHLTFQNVQFLGHIEKSNRIYRISPPTRSGDIV